MPNVFADMTRSRALTMAAVGAAVLVLGAGAAFVNLGLLGGGRSDSSAEPDLAETIASEASTPPSTAPQVIVQDVLVPGAGPAGGGGSGGGVGPSASSGSGSGSGSGVRGSSLDDDRGFDAFDDSDGRVDDRDHDDDDRDDDHDEHLHHEDDDDDDGSGHGRGRGGDEDD